MSLSPADDSNQELDDSDAGAVDPAMAGRILAAAEAGDAAVVASMMRGANFIVFQQIDPETGEIEVDEQGNFSVVLAEVDEDTAVVCFSDEEAASGFAKEIAGEVPEGQELPSVLLDGESLLEGLPSDCGLLVNPATDKECYFPPGALEV